MKLIIIVTLYKNYTYELLDGSVYTDICTYICTYLHRLD